MSQWVKILDLRASFKSTDQHKSNKEESAEREATKNPSDYQELCRGGILPLFNKIN